jgi:hypothetical protein
MAINVAVEIFVIKRLSVLSLVVIFAKQRWQRTQRRRFVQDAKKIPALGLQELA